MNITGLHICPRNINRNPENSMFYHFLHWIKVGKKIKINRKNIRMGDKCIKSEENDPFLAFLYGYGLFLYYCGFQLFIRLTCVIFKIKIQ